MKLTAEIHPYPESFRYPQGGPEILFIGEFIFLRYYKIFIV